MKVRLFAVLREIAGASEVDAALETDRPTVAGLLATLDERYGDRFAQISARSSVVVNGETAVPATSLSERDEVAILPPVSGGRTR